MAESQDWWQMYFNSVVRMLHAVNQMLHQKVVSQLQIL